MKNKRSFYIGITVTVFSLIAGIFLPDMILNIINNKMLDSVKTAPQEYYIGSKNALSKKASEDMTIQDKMKLASGVWESTITEADETEGTISSHEAIRLAANQMEYYYSRRVFPESLISTYNNWYLAEAKLYFCVDSTFNTYSTYIWVIHFTKYDNSVESTVVMTENGSILSAYINEDFDTIRTISDPYYKYTLKELWNERKLSNYNIKRLDEFPYEPGEIYPETDLTGAEFMSIYDITLKNSNMELQDYIIFQYKKDNGYGIGVLPY